MGGQGREKMMLHIIVRHYFNNILNKLTQIIINWIIINLIFFLKVIISAYHAQIINVINVSLDITKIMKIITARNVFPHVNYNYVQFIKYLEKDIIYINFAF